MLHIPTGPTPTEAGLARRFGAFATLADALDYAADVREDFTQQSAALTLRWAFQL